MSSAAVINATQSSGQTAGSPVTIITDGTITPKLYGTGSGAWSVTANFAPVVGGVIGDPISLTITQNTPNAVGPSTRTDAVQWVGWITAQAGLWSASGIVEGITGPDAQSGFLGSFAVGALPQYAVEAGSVAMEGGTLVRYGGAGVGWVADEVTVFPGDDIAAVHARLAAAGGGVIKFLAMDYPISAMLPLGGGVSYIGAESTTCNIMFKDGTGTVIDCGDRTFTAFGYNISDSATPPTHPYLNGADKLGASVKNIIVKNAQYAVKAGAKWSGGITQLHLDRVYALECDYGFHLENCHSPIIGTIKAYNHRKSALIVGSSTPGWNYGNFNIEHIESQSLNVMEPGHPAVMLMARGGTSELNDVLISHIQTNGSQGVNSENFPVALTNGSPNIDVKTAFYASKLDVGHPVFFAEGCGFSGDRPYFVLSKVGTIITVGQLADGTPFSPNATTSSWNAYVRGCIGIALIGYGADGRVTNCKIGLIDAEACSVSVYAQSYRGLIVDFGMMDQWDASIGKVAFAGNTRGSGDAECSLRFAEHLQRVYIPFAGNHFGSGPWPRTVKTSGSNMLRGVGISPATGLLVTYGA